MCVTRRMRSLQEIAISGGGGMFNKDALPACRGWRGRESLLTLSKILRLREKNDSIDRDIWGNRALMRVMCVRCDYQLVDSSLLLSVHSKKQLFSTHFLTCTLLFTVISLPLCSMHCRASPRYQCAIQHSWAAQ